MAESEFYSTTIKDAPALFGEEAISVHYHLEAMILFARASLDIACGLFAPFLPEPFPRKRFDSFNKLVKTMVKTLPDLEISSNLEALRDDNTSWFSVLCGMEKGRSLRDKIVHQTEFPIELGLTPFKTLKVSEGQFQPKLGLNLSKTLSKTYFRILDRAFLVRKNNLTS